MMPPRSTKARKRDLRAHDAAAKRAAKKLWLLADRVNATTRAGGLDTIIREKVSRAAQVVAVTAAVLYNDDLPFERRDERAYCDTLRWMAKRGFNTNEHFQRELGKQLHLKRRVTCRP